MQKMNKPLEQIAAEAVQLPPDDRERLLGILLASLQPELGNQEAWIEELERRMAAVEDGSNELIPGEEVFARIRSELK
ncbi:addiction module protein [Massilia sp. SR12]